jgi:ribosome maturation factor RimP
MSLSRWQSNPKAQALEALLSPSVSAMGFEWWGCEVMTFGRMPVVRIFVEGANGITVGECQKVSRQIQAVMTVENAMAGDFRLEVSSPGLDRQLFSVEQLKRYIGRSVKLKCKEMVEGQRQMTGILQTIHDNDLDLKLVDGRDVKVAFDNIIRANLIPEL